MTPSDPRRSGDGWIIQAIQDAREESVEAHKRLREETKQIWVAFERKREKDEETFIKILLALTRLEEARQIEEKIAVRKASLIAVSVSTGIAIITRLADWWAKHP